MAISARGTVYLGGVRFTCDPAVYERQWPKRVSVHEGLQGAVTVQDFGRFAKDMVLRLESGEQQLMERTTVAALDAMAGTRGATYTLTDWTGLECTVHIQAFEADPTFLGTLHRYRLSLRVLSIAKLYGATYTGS